MLSSPLFSYVFPPSRPKSFSSLLIKRFFNNSSSSSSSPQGSSGLRVFNPLSLTSSMDTQEKSKQNVVSLVLSMASLEDALKEVLATLDLLPSSYSEILDDLKKKALKLADLTEDDVISFIEERSKARNDKDYERSAIKLALISWMLGKKQYGDHGLGSPDDGSSPCCLCGFGLSWWSRGHLGQRASAALT